MGNEQQQTYHWAHQQIGNNCNADSSAPVHPFIQHAAYVPRTLFYATGRGHLAVPLSYLGIVAGWIG